MINLGESRRASNDNTPTKWTNSAAEATNSPHWEKKITDLDRKPLNIKPSWFYQSRAEFVLQIIVKVSFGFAQIHFITALPLSYLRLCMLSKKGRGQGASESKSVGESLGWPLPAGANKHPLPPSGPLIPPPPSPTSLCPRVRLQTNMEVVFASWNSCCSVPHTKFSIVLFLTMFSMNSSSESNW